MNKKKNNILIFGNLSPPVNLAVLKQFYPEKLGATDFSSLLFQV